MDWRTRAACRDYDPELFSALPGSVDERTALRICAGCPVASQCLEQGYAIGDVDTIRGGTTGAYRQQELIRHHRNHGPRPRMPQPRRVNRDGTNATPTTDDVLRMRDLADAGRSVPEIEDLTGFHRDVIDRVRNPHRTATKKGSRP